MRTIASAVIAALILASGAQAAHADDYGPHPDLRTIAHDARALLAHRARLQGLDPKRIAISDTVAVGNQAVLSWDISKEHGVMGLVRVDDRWWDALEDATYDPGPDRSRGCWGGYVTGPLNVSLGLNEPPSPRILHDAGFSPALVSAAAAHSVDFRPPPSATPGPNGNLVKPGCIDDIYAVTPDFNVHPGGAVVTKSRIEAAGYDITIRYAPNDAPAGTALKEFYVRAPTTAEMLHDPPPAHGGANALVFLSIAIDGPKPVTFRDGTTIDVWFPFALEPNITYTLLFDGTAQRFTAVRGKEFDNVVDFELPSFTLKPGQEAAGEIDGNPL